MTYNSGKHTTFYPCHWCGKRTRTSVRVPSLLSRYGRDLPRCGACKVLGKVEPLTPEKR